MGVAAGANDVSGGCLCGAVRFTAKLSSHDVAVCHCGMCRRWTGGPLMYLDTEGAPSFEGKESITVYRSSEQGERGFCNRCGSILFWKVAGEDRYTFAAGSLDDASKLVLAKEIFIEDKPGFYDFANDTQRLTGAEAMTAYVGGTDKTN
jgi:hypothetical protein